MDEYTPVDMAGTRADRDKRLIDNSPAIALFSTGKDDKISWVTARRSFERIALLYIQRANLTLLPDQMTE